MRNEISIIMIVIDVVNNGEIYYRQFMNNMATHIRKRNSSISIGYKIISIYLFLFGIWIPAKGHEILNK